ncbi:PEP-CTERM sorting domain-containing protein [Rugamonas fusca]|uniref:PEP-CTERM sorting domain-containing protein n=1 Tax=Rugamonas fusca TaxID=2758568 RepID=UPI001E4563A9|nr:PEP-CTERM sorting domain-containing protein [Rugamonas fusca]
MKLKAILSTSILAGLVTVGAPAMALGLACTNVSVGNASRNDVTLDGEIADSCLITTSNPQQGPNGNISAFNGQWPGGPWSLLSKVTGSSVASATSTATFGGVNYKINFTETPGSDAKKGTWTITVNKPVTVDLVFAMHASNNSGVFFFDNQALSSSPLGNTGNWVINWVNHGGQVPGFSNLTIFARDQHVSAVPEPETYAMLLAGFGVLGFMARRRKQK